MKKLVLSIIILCLLFLPRSVYAQAGPDCHGVFTKESNACLKESTKCIDSCVEKGYAAMSLTVDGGKVMKECTRSICDPASKACNDKATANFRSCQDAKKEGSNSQKENPKDNESSLFKIFGINPFETWLSLKTFSEAGAMYFSGALDEAISGFVLHSVGVKTIAEKDAESRKGQEKVYESIFGKDWQEQLKQVNQPKIETKTETDAWSLPVSNGEKTVDVPGTTDTKRYSWDENSGVVIKSNDWEKIEFKEPKITDDIVTRTVQLKEGGLEVKVRNNDPVLNQFSVDAGLVGITVSRTHFSVLKSPDGKSAVVTVYEGEVEVKAKDGQTIKVSPQNGEPGMAVVSKKLSPVKLGIVGVVLLGIIAGVFLVLKKKFTLTKGIKKNK